MRTSIRSLADLDALEATVIASAQRTLDALPTILSGAGALALMSRLKFYKSGFHPTESRALNLIEQINQTFTFIASVQACRWLFEKHPQVAPFVLNLGAVGGLDIRSSDGSIAAETFATVDPRNNKKLLKDIAKVAKSDARFKYVFYMCPSHGAGEPRRVLPDVDVLVVSLGWREDAV